MSEKMRITLDQAEELAENQFDVEIRLPRGGEVTISGPDFDKKKIEKILEEFNTKKLYGDPTQLYQTKEA